MVGWLDVERWTHAWIDIFLGGVNLSVESIISATYVITDVLMNTRFVVYSATTACGVLNANGEITFTVTN